MDDSIVGHFPALANGFDWESSRGIKAMHCVHDGGEIKSKDLAFSNPDYDQLKALQMDKERWGFQNLLNRYVTDPRLYQTAWNAFARYQNIDLLDKDAVFAHLINMVSGIRFGLEHVYNNGFTACELDHQHAERSVEGLFKYGVPMLTILDGEEKAEMIAFLSGEIEGYRSVGFIRLADQAQETLRGLATPSISEPQSIPQL